MSQKNKHLCITGIAFLSSISKPCLMIFSETKNKVKIYNSWATCHLQALQFWCRELYSNTQNSAGKENAYKTMRSHWEQPQVNVTWGEAF